VPWKDILTSVPFWALMITHTLNNFGWYMLLVELPSFMSAGLGLNIKEVLIRILILQGCEIINWPSFLECFTVCHAISLQLDLFYILQQSNGHPCPKEIDNHNSNQENIYGHRLHFYMSISSKKYQIHNFFQPPWFQLAVLLGYACQGVTGLVLLLVWL